MSKFQIDLNNYEHLLDLFENDKQLFADNIRSILLHLDNALKNGRLQASKEVYKMPYMKMMNDVMDAFFEVEGIVRQHSNEAEKHGLRALQYDMHPLAIFTNDAPVYDIQGNNISPREYMRQDLFDIKNWLYSLFYGARFVSWGELSTYLSLGKHELIDALKTANLKHLLDIQPALNYQKENGITEGKLIPGAGLFDGGDNATKNLDRCPACGSEEWNKDHEKYSFCPKCRLGGLK